MATVTVQSLLNCAVYDSYTVTIASDTVNSLKSQIAAADGTNTAWFDLVLNEQVLTGTDTLATAGVVNGDALRIHNKIAGLANKQAKQEAKLELAALDRAAYGSRRAIYDINELPTKYSTNAVVDNSNPDGLLAGRPWVDVSRTGLQLYLDPASTASYPGSGTSITDLSTNAYTGTLVNGVGFSNDALTFDGSNDYIDMNTAIAATNFTVISWFKCSNDTTVPRMIVSKETTAGGPWNYRIWLYNGTVQADIASSPVALQGISTATNCGDNAWHMAAFVRDTVADTLTLYVDNVLKATATETLVNPNLVPNAQEVWFGRSAFTAGGVNPTGSYPYVGSLGEQMIYDRAMTADEIAITYRATRSRYGV